MRKNITALFLAVVMAVTLLPTAFAAGNGYSDTQGHWGEDAIDRWSGYGVISGTGSGLFDPNAPLTRAQAAQIFANLLNLSATASVAQYTDVTVGSWYYDAIAKCVAAGILNGTDSNTMSPNTYVSREELFVMFARALGIQPQASAGVTFTDSASTASWAAGYVNALADMGVVGGSGDGTLAPKADIDRASVVALLDKAITAYGNTSGATVGSSSGIVLVVADNVTVMGSVETLVVAGGSAGISGSTVGSISVVGESASVSVGGSANVGQVSVTGANASVTVRGEATVSGVTIADTAQGAELTVSGDATVTAVDSAAQNVTISGDGTIEAATVSGDNTTVDTNGTDLTVSEGTTGVTENDKGVSAGDSVVTEPTEDASASDESTTPSRPTNPSRPSYDYYTVTFMLDENTVYDTQRVREGSTVTEPADPTTTQDCKVFGGWYLDGALYDFTTPVNADLTLVAKWADAHTYEMREIRAADAPDTTVATQEVCSVCDDAKEIVLNGNAAAQVGDLYYINLNNAVSSGGTVDLLKDVISPTESIVVNGTTVILNLNGNTISASGYDGAIYAKNGAQVTINGDGMIIGNDVNRYAMAVWSNGTGTHVTINGGTYQNNKAEGNTDEQMDMIYASDGGTITINGGTLDCITPKWTLNVKDADYKENPDTIQVYGGTFKNYNPAEAANENPVANFVADGYTVTTEEDGEDTWYTVVPLTAENSAAEVNGVYYENLTDAIAAADGGTVTMLKDAVFTDTCIVTGTVTLDMNGHTISNTSDIWDQDAGKWSLISVRDDGDLTITGNGTLSTLKNDIYAVDVYDDTSRCTIESGTFIGNVHAVYVRDGELTVKGGHFSVQQKYSQEQPYEFVLNCFDANYKAETAKITVTGGTFENFDPADCEAEGKGTNFVAEGYTVTSEVISEDTTWYTVVPLTAENSAAEVNGVYYENLTDAIAAADDNAIITLFDEIALEEDLTIEKNLIINGSGNTIITEGSIRVSSGYGLTINDVRNSRKHP